MSKVPHLPDDPARWPNDPFKLLGVSRKANRRELRRAYSKLIRLYKPDDSPAKFERLRDAYHAAQQYIQDDSPPSRSPGPFQDAQPTWTQPPTPKQPPHQTFDTSHGPVPWHGGDRSFYGSLNEIWKDERLTDRAALYANLCRLLQNYPGSEETFIRLYWSLKLWPNLDKSREPCQWLADGLRSCGVYGRLSSLYVRELESRPEEGLAPEFKSLIEYTKGTEFFPQLVGIRWQCAGRLKSWDTIIDELQDFRNCVKFDDHSAWTKLILAAADQLAWGRAREAKTAFESCRDELHQNTTNDPNLWNELERFDYLHELSSAWHKLLTRRGPVIGRDYQFLNLTNLIRDSWCHPHDVIRPQFLDCLSVFVGYRKQSLRALDFMGSNSGTAIHYLRSTLSSFSCHHRQSRPSPNTDVLFADFQRFTDQHGESWQAYNNQRQLRQYEVRLALLQFCLRRSLPPHMLVEHLTSSGYGIVNDVSLDCLYEAHQAFWN